MSAKQELSITGCWIDPHSNITYLEKAEFRVEIKNDSKHTLEIIKISCRFEAENDLPPHIFSREPMISIKPGNISSLIKIPFTVDLSLREATNYSLLEITYRYAKSVDLITATFGYPDTRYLIIKSVHSPEKHFFISHKDPVQTQLGTKLDYHLIKIGFRGYLAENDKSPGLDIWNDKIIPNIDGCVALVVLWTAEATKDSKRILREVKRAKRQKKKIIVLAEKDVKIHKIFKGTKEYYRVAEGKVKEIDLIELVEHIEKLYRSGAFLKTN